MPKVAFFEIEDWEVEYIKDKLPGYQLKFYTDYATKDNVKDVQDYDAFAIFIYSMMNPELLGLLPNVKFITTMSTGFDHIDVNACKQRGIPVSTVPSYGDNTVAEHAFALILAISRKIVQSVDRTRKGDFTLEGLRGFDLKGKTIGVVGTGRIGKNVIRIANGFHMNILAYDKFPDQSYAKEQEFSYVDFDTLLAQSDVITLHTPYTPETHHLINMNNVSKIKKGAVLINTARGGLIETHALIKALEDRTISYAGLDVLEEECFIREEKQLLSRAFQKECDLSTALEEHMLIEQENVLITPHNAFNSKEALQRILDTTIQNIKSFFEGRPENVVNK